MEACDADRAREWVADADRDLEAAGQLADDEGLLRPALYHAHLAAEKTLKGYLVYSAIEIPVTHDLTLLADLIAAREPAAAALRDAAEQLNPYGTAYRNAEEFSPDRDEYRRAIGYAFQLHEYVCGRMTGVVQPG